MVTLATGASIFHISMTRPGAAGVAPSKVSEYTGLTVMLFAHPECSCSTDSIRTLARLADMHGINVTIYMSGPAASTPEWRRSTNARVALTEQGLGLAHDPHGTTAHRYGALTSGHTVVYDAKGTLVFQGGLTAARGAVGPSSGWKALDDILNGRPPETHSTPVFGCSLFNGSDREISS